MEGWDGLDWIAFGKVDREKALEGGIGACKSGVGGRMIGIALDL